MLLKDGVPAYANSAWTQWMEKRDNLEVLREEYPDLDTFLSDGRSVLDGKSSQLHKITNADGEVLLHVPVPPPHRRVINEEYPAKWGRWRWSFTKRTMYLDAAGGTFFNGKREITLEDAQRLFSAYDWRTIQRGLEDIKAGKEVKLAFRIINGARVEATGTRDKDGTSAGGILWTEEEDAALLHEQTRRRAAEARGEELAFLSYFSEQILGSSSKIDVARKICSAVSQYLGGIVLVSEAQDDVFQITAASASSTDTVVMQQAKGIVGNSGKIPAAILQAVAAEKPWIKIPDITTVSGIDAIRVMAENSGTKEAIILSLSGENGMLGAISCYRADGFTDAEVIILEEVARRSERAFFDATLKERGRDLLDALQKSVLPETLPARAEWRLAASYRPADGMPVGGDFYDVFESGSGLDIVMGDVAGHGLKAATMMGQLRSGIRALALSGSNVLATLSGVDKVVSLEEDALATVIYAHLDTSGHFSWASSGHFAPIRLRDGKAVVLDGEAGPPLGVGEYFPGLLHVGHVQSGDRLVFFTDGLVERRSKSLQAGLDFLGEVVERTKDLAVSAAVEEVLKIMLQEKTQDDTCLLIVDVA